MVELIYVCTRCLKQHKLAAAAAGCCYVMSVFWKCTMCASVFPYEKKSLAEDHEMHYKPEMLFLIGGKNMSKQLDLEEALNFETELEILKAELQINKDKLNNLETDFSYLDNEEIFFTMNHIVKNEIKAELKREGKGRTPEGLVYDLLKDWCNYRNIDIEKFKIK